MEQFNYTDKDIGDIVTACVYNVSFLGITGQVKFAESGDPLRNIKIDQIQSESIRLPEINPFLTDELSHHIIWVSPPSILRTSGVIYFFFLFHFSLKLF